MSFFGASEALCAALPSSRIWSLQGQSSFWNSTFELLLSLPPTAYLESWNLQQPWNTFPKLVRSCRCFACAALVRQYAVFSKRVPAHNPASSYRRKTSMSRKATRGAEADSFPTIFFNSGSVACSFSEKTCCLRRIRYSNRHQNTRCGRIMLFLRSMDFCTTAVLRKHALESHCGEKSRQPLCSPRWFHKSACAEAVENGIRCIDRSPSALMPNHHATLRQAYGDVVETRKVRISSRRVDLLLCDRKRCFDWQANGQLFHWCPT